MDDECASFLRRLTGNEKEKNEGVKPFMTLSDKNVREYCTIKKIIFKPREDDFKRYLDKLEQEYPGIKNSFLKSSLQV